MSYFNLLPDLVYYLSNFLGAKYMSLPELAKVGIGVSHVYTELLIRYILSSTSVWAQPLQDESQRSKVAPPWLWCVIDVHLPWITALSSTITVCTQRTFGCYSHDYTHSRKKM